MIVAAGRAASATASQAERVEVTRHRIDNEERDLRRAIQRAVDKAHLRSERRFAEVKAQLPTWISNVNGKDAEAIQRAWAHLLGKLEVDDLLQGVSDDIQTDAKVSGLLLDREDRLEERLQSRRLGAKPREARNPLAALWHGIGRLIGLVMRHVPRMLSRAPLGPVGWAVVVVDVLATGAKGISDEVRASSIDRHAWEQDAGRAGKDELARVRKRLTDELDVVREGLTKSANEHFDQARAELKVVDENLSALSRYAQHCERVVSTIDRWTVERILHLGGVRATVVKAQRIPNLYLRIEVVGDQSAARQWLSAVFDGCVQEEVTITQHHQSA